MNRPKKFRAWNKQAKKMIRDANSGICIYMNGTVSQGGEWVTGLYDIIQFTGLLDKEGREIWEGDILMYPDTESEHVSVGIGMIKVAESQINSFWPVEFRDGEFGMDIKGGELVYGASEEQPTWLSLRTFFEDYVVPKECQVIGNIFQNKDLLE